MESFLLSRTSIYQSAVQVLYCDSASLIHDGALLAQANKLASFVLTLVLLVLYAFSLFDFCPSRYRDLKSQTRDEKIENLDKVAAPYLTKGRWNVFFAQRYAEFKSFNGQQQI